MSESEQQRPMPELDPDNPYNIDYEREKRLMRIFWIFIGGAFVLAALALGLAFVLDTVFEEQPPPPPNFPVNSNTSSDASTPACPVQPLLWDVGEGVFA
jgi:hypothetical protein